MISSISGSSSYDRTSMTSQIAQKMFKKLDTNSNGGIDETELSAIAGSGQTRDLSQIFSKMDINSDGKIDETENESALQKLSSKMESLFQKAGSQSGMPPPPNPDELFSKLDANSDGGIDQDEFSALNQNGKGPQFSEIDTNSDGVIDDTENSDFMKKIGPPPGPPPGGMRGMSSKKDTQEISGVTTTKEDSFANLLSALQSTFEEDENDETSATIQQLFTELKNSAKYSAQGNINYSLSGTDSMFSLIA